MKRIIITPNSNSNKTNCYIKQERIASLGSDNCSKNSEQNQRKLSLINRKKFNMSPGNTLTKAKSCGDLHNTCTVVFDKTSHKLGFQTQRQSIEMRSEQNQYDSQNDHHFQAQGSLKKLRSYDDVNYQSCNLGSYFSSQNHNTNYVQKKKTKFLKYELKPIIQVQMSFSEAQKFNTTNKQLSLVRQNQTKKIIGANRRKSKRKYVKMKSQGKQQLKQQNKCKYNKIGQPRKKMIRDSVLCSNCQKMKRYVKILTLQLNLLINELKFQQSRIIQQLYQSKCKIFANLEQPINNGQFQRFKQIQGSTFALSNNNLTSMLSSEIKKSLKKSQNKQKIQNEQDQLIDFSFEQNQQSFVKHKVDQIIVDMISAIKNKQSEWDGTQSQILQRQDTTQRKIGKICKNISKSKYNQDTSRQNIQNQLLFEQSHHSKQSQKDQITTIIEARKDGRCQVETTNTDLDNFQRLQDKNKFMTSEQYPFENKVIILLNGIK